MGETGADPSMQLREAARRSGEPWHAPGLRCLGTLRELTASGSGNESESIWPGGGLPSNCKLPIYSNHWYCTTKRP